MLTLTSFVDVLQNVTLDLHVIVLGVVLLRSVALNLVDEPIQVVVLSCGIVA